MPDCILISDDQAMLTAATRHRGRLQPLGRFEADRQGAAALGAAIGHTGKRPLPAIISPSTSQTLSKVISLPLVARRNLARVLEFEMDHETPFCADDVFWCYRVQRLDRVAERLDVELVLVRRQTVEKVRGLVEAAGLRLDALEVQDSSGRRNRIGLSDGAAREGSKAPRVNVGLAGLLALLAIAAVVLPFVRLEQALGGTRAEVDRLHGIAVEATTLRKQIQQLTSAARFLASERSRVRNPLMVMAAATRALPASSYLTEFSLRGDHAVLVGLSPSAANLIPALASTKPFRDATFGAPVVRPDGNKLELFTINAALDAASGQ